MTVIVEDVKLKLFALDLRKISDDSIQAAIDDQISELTFLRKSDVPDDVFDLAVKSSATLLIALEANSATSISTLGFTKAGMDQYIVNLRRDALKACSRVTKRPKQIIANNCTYVE